MTEFTLADIREASARIKEMCEPSIIYEDDYQRIWARNGTAEKIQFKKKGVDLFKKLLEDVPQSTPQQSKVKTIYGIPILESKFQ